MIAPVHAFDLSAVISPSLAGIAGAIFGAGAFLAVVFVFMRRPAKAFEASSESLLPVPVPGPGPAPFAAFDRTALPVAPSQGYARMGFAFGERVEQRVEKVATDAPGHTAPLPKVTVSPIVVLSGPSEPVDRAPSPLGVIAGSSFTLQPKGASVAELSFDDGPTVIAETYFDELPQPAKMGSRPKIRRVEPTPPRSEEVAARRVS